MRCNFEMEKTVLFSCTLPGRCYVKKGTQKVFGNRLVYSPQFQMWQRQAILEIANIKMKLNWKQPVTDFVHLKCLFFFGNHQAEADLSALYEGVQDVLEKCKIIENDRLILSHDGSRKLFEKDKWFTEVRLYKFHD